MGLQGFSTREVSGLLWSSGMNNVETFPFSDAYTVQKEREADSEFQFEPLIKRIVNLKKFSFLPLDQKTQFVSGFLNHFSYIFTVFFNINTEFEQKLLSFLNPIVTCQIFLS